MKDKIMKEIEEVWSKETQIGFSELAMEDAISRTIKSMEEKMIKREHTFQVNLTCAREGMKEKQKADFRKMIEELKFNPSDKKIPVVIDGYVVIIEELLAKLDGDEVK